MQPKLTIGNRVTTTRRDGVVVHSKINNLANSLSFAMPKILFRSGNYALCLDRINNQIELVRLAESSGCTHPEHYVGKNYPNTLDALDDAAEDCICMAAKSLKAGSGEKIAKIE